MNAVGNKEGLGNADGFWRSNMVGWCLKLWV